MFVSNEPFETGNQYVTEVPDTLDLAERARLGVHHFMSNVSEAHDFELCWRGDYKKSDKWAWPGYRWFQTTSLMACQPKAAEALAMGRFMSGSREHVDREARMLDMLVSNIGDDGLYYLAKSGGRKPWCGPEEDRPLANVHGQGRMMRAMTAWHQYTGNSAWSTCVDRMVNGLDRIVVHNGDFAYFPTRGRVSTEYFRSCYQRSHGWEDTSEPANEKGGEEGSLFNHQGHIPGVLANWYLLTGNEQALRLSGELVRFLMKPKFWADRSTGDYPRVSGAEHAHWAGHFHGHINVLRAILEYAIVTNDSRIMSFVRDGYEWSRQAGFARIGYYDGQGCACARIIGLAIKLSDAGIGDYWEDVDQYIRNHGTELQFVPEDIPHLEAWVKTDQSPDQPPEMIAEHPTGMKAGTIDAGIGGFSMGYAPLKTGYAMCCSTHGNMGLFYAWHGALRFDGGIARVNLLLNRASPWLDVESHLPYEGKVVIRNKEATEALVRIPLWVDQKAVRCSVSGQDRPWDWISRYLRLRGLRRGDVVTIQFPMVEVIEEWTVPDLMGGGMPTERRTCRFRGNTLVEMTPPLAPGSFIYQRRKNQYDAQDHAPLQKVTRHVTRSTLRW